MKKKSLAALLMVCVLLIVAACGAGNNQNNGENTTNSTSGANSETTTENSSDGQEPTTVTMMTSQAKYKESYRKIADKLKEEENITLDIQVVPDDQFFNLVKAKIASREVPDIIIHNAPTAYVTMDAENKMVDLSNEPWVSRMANPDLMKASDGKIYAMPQESSSFYAAAYYNKKVFADLGLSEPSTYDEFLSLLETIKTKGNGITPIYMSDKDSWTTQIYMTAGLPVLLEDKAQETWDKLLTNEMKWADIPEFKTILSDFKDLYDKGYTNKDHLTQTFEDAKAALAAGEAAMILNGEWSVADLMTKNGMDADNIGAFVIPIGNHDVMATGAYVQGFYVPKDAKNIEGAKRVLNLWSTPEYMNIHFADNPGSPGFVDVDGGDVHPAVLALEENYIQTGKYVFQMNDPMQFVNPVFPDLWSLYVDLTAGAKSIDDVIEQWDQKYADYMKQHDQPNF